MEQHQESTPIPQQSRKIGRPSKQVAPEFQTCTKCMTQKNINEFYKIRDNIYHPRCKKCTLAARKDRHQSTYVKKIYGVNGLSDDKKAMVYSILDDNSKEQREKINEIGILCGKTPQTIKKWLSML